MMSERKMLMPFKEYVYSVLVASSSEKFNTSLMTMLPQKSYEPVDIVHSINHARRKSSERHYDLVIINTPLPDDFGRKFAIDLCEHNNTVVVLLVRNEIYDEIYDKVLEYGVLTLRKPTSSTILNQALDWMCMIKHRLAHLEINRAKWALIEACHMTEESAHRYIEKQAMDRCVTRREIAERILQTYK